MYIRALKSLLWICIAIFFFPERIFAEPGIAIDFKNRVDQKIYLGSYFGRTQIILDSIQLDDQGKGLFAIAEKYTQGLYFLKDHQKQLLLEFLMDEDQNFLITQEADGQNLLIKGSAENEHFLEYSKFLNSRLTDLKRLREEMANASQKDSVNLLALIRKKELELENYRSDHQKAYPASLLGFLFRTSKQVQIPDSLIKTDPNLYPEVQKLIYDKYWSGIDFSDDRLLRTPYFDPKIERYFKDYVPINPDIIISEVSKILESARLGKGDLFKYLLLRFTEQYIRPRYIGQDKVFMYLFDQYYAKEKNEWMDSRQRAFIFERGSNLRANQIGNTAAALELTGLNGRKQKLAQIDAPLTLVLFWDPSCKHCIEELPKLNTLYRQYWRAGGMKIFAVNTDFNPQRDWAEFINKHGLEEWTHAFLPLKKMKNLLKKGKPGFKQLYDVQTTPTIYLLDENKRILAKNITVDQLELFIKSLR